MLGIVGCVLMFWVYLVTLFCNVGGFCLVLYLVLLICNLVILWCGCFGLRWDVFELVVGVVFIGYFVF